MINVVVNDDISYITYNFYCFYICINNVWFKQVRLEILVHLQGQSNHILIIIFAYSVI